MAGNGRQNARSAVALSLAAGTTIRDAAAGHGVGERTVGRWWADPQFRAEVKALRDGLMAAAAGKMADGMSEAATVPRQLLHVRSETVRLSAARALLELGVRVRDAVDFGDRVGELERLAATQAEGGRMSRGRLGRRLDRVAGILAATPAATGADEGRELAAEMGQTFGQLIAYYREQYGLTPGEAHARAADTPGCCVDRALGAAPEQLSWLDLGAIAQRDPDRAKARWDEVKAAARGEVRSGHRAARAVEGGDSQCWPRARFLAVRAELTAAWRPRNPAEQHLVDQMAQYQELAWHWLETVTSYRELRSAARRRGDPVDRRHPEPPRLSDGQALELAGRMVERFQGLYLRSLRALRDLRRLPPVIVRAAGQVNVADQQVNVIGAGGSFPTRESPAPLPEQLM